MCAYIITDSVQQSNGFTHILPMYFDHTLTQSRHTWNDLIHSFIIMVEKWCGFNWKWMWKVREQQKLLINDVINVWALRWLNDGLAVIQCIQVHITHTLWHIEWFESLIQFKMCQLTNYVSKSDTHINSRPKSCYSQFQTAIFFIYTLTKGQKRTSFPESLMRFT